MDLTPRVLFVIAFMMVSTYTCNAIVFPEDTTDYLNNQGGYRSFEPTLWSFPEWLDFVFDIMYQELLNDVTPDTYIRRSSIVTREYIAESYRDSITGWGSWDRNKNGIFEEYGYIWQTPTGSWNTNPINAGVRWYNSEWVQGQGFLEWAFGETRASRIEDEYTIYVQAYNGEHSGSLIDTITLFLGNLWDGFAQLIKLLTFTNIPNCPMWIVGLLNVFFIPMWIVLIVGIAPYVSDLIKAISSFIESFTPW